MKNKLKFLYEPRDEKKYFGKRFRFKGRHYIHGKDTKIAEVKTIEGNKLEVFICAMPARFYTFVIDREFEIETGSGKWDDYKNIFELLKDSMLKVGASIK